MPNFARAVERARWAEAKQILGALRGAQLRYKAEKGAYTSATANFDLEITTPKYFTFIAINSTGCVAQCTRNATQDNFSLSGNTICISETGNFTYSGGVPGWLQ